MDLLIRILQDDVIIEPGNCENLTPVWVALEVSEWDLRCCPLILAQVLLRHALHPSQSTHARLHMDGVLITQIKMCISGACKVPECTPPPH